MIHRVGPIRSRSVVQLIFYFAVVIGVGSLAFSKVTPNALASNEDITRGLPSQKFKADLTFSLPKRFAVISDPGENIQRLYAPGGLVFQQKNWNPVLRIERIENQGVVIRHTKKGKKQLVMIGGQLPGLPHLLLKNVVGLTELHYGFKVVDTQPDREPHVQRIDGSRAFLVQEVLKAALPPRQSHLKTSTTPKQDGLLPKGLITQVKVTQVDDDTYDVDKESLKPLHQSLRQSLRNPKETFGLAISLMTNRKTELHTPAADATLSAEGFTLTRFDEAKNLGLRVGDRIISINDQPVNSPLVAWGLAARLITQNQKVTHLDVGLIRDGLPKTKRYRLK